MNEDQDELRYFPEADLLVNDNVAHPFSSPEHAKTLNRPLDDLPGFVDSSFHSTGTADKIIPMEFDRVANERSTTIDQGEQPAKREEHDFHRQDIEEQTDIERDFMSFDQMLFKGKKFDSIVSNLNEQWKDLQMDTDRVQRVTTQLHT